MIILTHFRKPTVLLFSCQTKAFIDRTFSYIKPDYLTNPQPFRLEPGKKVVWITSQEDGDPMH